MSNEEREQQQETLKEHVIGLTGLQAYLQVFRMLPRPIRLLGYLGLIVALPFYLGLTPKLAQDLFNEPLEDWQIRLGWRDPRVWTGRYSSGAVKEFTTSRWDGASKASLGEGNALMLKPDQSVFYKLKSDVFGLYDFYVRFDVEVLDGQKELHWLVRADHDRESYYKFRLQWDEESPYWRFDGFTMDADADEEDPLFVNEHLLEVNPLKKGDKLSILLYARECIFDHRFLVDRGGFDDSEDFEDSGEGGVLASTSFAEKPCLSYGDFGLTAPAGSPGAKLQTMEICSQANEEAMKDFCGDFKGYFRPDPRKEPQ
jgi:hypothetical protein